MRLRPDQQPGAGQRLAWLQRVLLALWGLALAGAVGSGLAPDPPPWAWPGAALLAGGHLLWLALLMALARAHNRADPALRVAGATWLRAWADEASQATRVFGWRQPFRAHAEPDHLPAAAVGRAGVVLVHGFVCNRGLWTPWLRRLRAEGVPVVAVTLEPVFGSIDDYAPTVEAAVQQMTQLTGRPPLLVGHSMGGLAIRAWGRTVAAPAQRVCGVVTIGTPHQGTWLGRFSHQTNGRQMAPASPWLQALAASEPPEWRARFHCWWSPCDHIVFPARTAVLPGGSDRMLPGTAHVALAFRPEVFEDVLRRLR